MSSRPSPKRNKAFMRYALALAGRGLGATAPNPSVGAVIVEPGDREKIVGAGWTGPGGRPHAEVVALEKAGRAAHGATAYVTLEPCAHHGETPPCADALIAAGIARVVCALKDPDPRVAGQGIERLRATGIEVETGVLSDEAHWHHLGHIRRVRDNRPFIQLKIAIAADGLIAAGDGAPVWVTGPTARDRGHLMRAQTDAILVGRGTVKADNPDLTCRLPGLGVRSPVRVVLDSNLATSPQCRLVQTSDRVPVWIIGRKEAERASERVLAESGAAVIRVKADTSGCVDLERAMAALAARGITRLMVEGGPSVSGSFVRAGLPDEVVIFRGPEKVGAEGLAPLKNATLEDITANDAYILHSNRRLGPDVMHIYRRRLSVLD